jgi:hypothetical protein
MTQNNDLDNVADDKALTVMSHERGEHWTFIRPFPEIRPTVPEKLDWVRNNCSYIVVLPIEHDSQAYVPHFMSDVGEYVLISWKRNHVDLPQLAFVTRSEYRGNDGSVGEYALFRSVGRRP